MNLAKILSKLQSRPEGSRRRLAYVSALFICFIIFLIWLSAGGVKIYQSAQTPDQPENSVASPLEVIGREINFAGQEISKGFKLLKENFRNSF